MERYFAVHDVVAKASFGIVGGLPAVGLQTSVPAFFGRTVGGG
jgi:hypothetical protein